MVALVHSTFRQPESTQEAAVQGRQYLTFTVTRDAFGIAIDSVKEIIEYRVPTRVPLTPGYMRGIINLRGRVVPVIDLAVRFGRDKVEATRRTCIVIVEAPHGEVKHDIGVLVDAVSAVVEIADADVEPSPSFGAKLRTDFISGMGKISESFVILLDIGKVLSIDELAMLSDARESLAALPGARDTGPGAGRAQAS